MLIKGLFDPSKDIYRTIEKVINYNAAEEARLRTEIREYIFTESIEDQLERWLTKMQAAMEAIGRGEVGVWVSGFYGSGKSSFTKYLALAFDEEVLVDGIRFLDHFIARLNRPQTRAQMLALVRQFPAAVIMLDLASDMLAGAQMEDVSTVLYYKVLQWAGFSRNLKVAALERRLQQDGRYEELTARVEKDHGLTWREMQNDPLAIDSLLPEIAHDLYPNLFRTPTSFSTETVEFVQSLKDQVEEILDIVRRKSGRSYVLFVIDEVGQYVADRKNLILNLQGLAENLKNVGDGKAWLIGTAQQTLTEDDPKAALNSPELYKLKDRFPIQIDLESRDIKEICYKRLLGKSTAGEDVLGDLFDRLGPPLRHHTRLEDARAYDADFDRQTFINLYPFLPAHFDILLHLLGVLAKSTGGVGLRSAIKVIQDILIETVDGQPAAADRPVGWLATTVTLYDALEKDIRLASPSVYHGVTRARQQFPGAPVHQDVAKTVAVLQMMGNLPITPHNVACLLHPAIDAPTQRPQIDAAIRDLKDDPLVPFGEKDNTLCFFSEKVNNIDLERATIPLRSIDTGRIRNEALRTAFTPLPSTRLQGSLLVTTGLAVNSGSSTVNLVGDRETIQTVIDFVAPEDFAAARTRLLDESRQRSAQYTIFLLGRTDREIDAVVAEIYRSREIAQRHRNELDPEVKEYCTGQMERATRLTSELEYLLRRALGQGSLIFRGETTAVESLALDVVEALKKYLAGVADQVFSRYAEAPVRIETAIAEKLLRLGNLRSVTAAVDPLNLVQISAGTPSVNNAHKALVSIRDYLDRNGATEGKRLTDHFADAPFGWSPDTLRYLVAAMLLGGQIKLKVAGRDITVGGQQAIDALRTNNTFKNVGVALRDGERLPLEVLGRAAERLTELTGETVLPFPEDEISKAALKHFPQFQFRYGPLAERLDGLSLPGGERVRELNQQVADILLTDASDAPGQLGSESSALYDGLKWANEVDLALKAGLEQTVRELKRYRSAIDALRSTGVPGLLRTDLTPEMEQLQQRLGQPTFYRHAADLATTLTAIRVKVRGAAEAMQASLAESVRDAQRDLAHLPDWKDLAHEDQVNAQAQLDNIVTASTLDLAGLEFLLTQEAELWAQVSVLKREIAQRAEERRRVAVGPGQAEGGRPIKERHTKVVRIPTRVTKAEQLDEAIATLQAIRAEVQLYEPVEIRVEWTETT
ncbi:MAG: BREX system P-loop protein BrxC [Burkholderiaceae bacterium]|nr:BREX system P-loop protein BrxC [Burkholderiaceae bacterium]